MISRDLIEIDHTIFKTLGVTEEQFLSLPEEFQRAFFYIDWQLCNNHNIDVDGKIRNNEKQKTKSLKQYEFEEKTKEKILTKIKKR